MNSLERKKCIKINSTKTNTLCVTNVLLLEKALEQISHLYFLQFFDLVEGITLINEVVVLGRIGDGVGMSSGGQRNGNVCQKVRDGMDRNGRNNTSCACKSFDSIVRKADLSSLFIGMNYLNLSVSFFFCCLKMFLIFLSSSGMYTYDMSCIRLL
jgi:hypothetical protein